MQNIIGLFQENQTIGTLFLLIILDITTGVTAATIKKEVSSNISYRGILKKLSIVYAVVLSIVLNPYAGGMNLVFLTTMGFIVTEGISILENLGKIGVTAPVLSRVLAVLKTQQKTEKDKDAN